MNNMPDSATARTSVLFVCMGNICRSPTAEGIFSNQLQSRGLTNIITTDSAGTHDYHTGHTPDDRAIVAAREHGYDISRLQSRQVTRDDFNHFDYILAMDRDNLAGLEYLKPKNHSGHLSLMLDFHPQLRGQEVPDPYYGGGQGFIRVIDMLQQSCSGLLDHIEIANKIDIDNR